MIPVKSRGAKSRLSGVLSVEERGDLTRWLLANVLRAVEGAGVLESCHVVSSDKGILRLAAAAGASTVPEVGDTGVNGAVRRGVRAAGGSRSVLVFPCDLPLLRAVDVRQVLSLHSEGMAVVISPSRAFDGTNALLCPTRPPFRLSYDRNSFWNHLRTAGGRGLPVAVCTREGILFDVDTPDDLRTLARSRSPPPGVRFPRRLLR